MKKINLFKTVLTLSSACLLAAGCAVEARGPGGEVYVDSAPPPAEVDIQTAIPGPGYVWIGGDWGWEGNRWVWHGGRWDRPPHAGARWVGGHYADRGGRHVYVRGGWR
jgi:WXXGXW repeat (2 copies)